MSIPEIRHERLEVRAHWSAVPMTLLRFTENVVAMIRHFRHAEPTLQDWAIQTNSEPWFAAWDGKAETLLPQLIDSNFSESKKEREAAKANPGKIFNKTSFRAHLSCTSAGGGPTDPPEHGGLTLDINSGAVTLATSGKALWTPESWIDGERVRTRSRAECSLRLPANHWGRLHSPAMLQTLLETLTSAWPSRRGSVDSFELLKQVFGMEPFGREQRATGGMNKVWPGWMSYFLVPNLPALLSEAGLEVKTAGDGSCLLLTDPGCHDLHRAEPIAAARRIDELLATLCINQHTVLIDGWPHDPAERLYAMQCGAPPKNQAVRVALAEFTAWDEPRETLVYARLFRGESVDDLKYLPETFHQSIDGMRPVAEAWRQLRSLELSNLRVQIEWHIGRDELVEPLRVLLHQHAGIDEARLRVLSTPYAE